TRQLYRFLQYMDKHYIYRLTDITTDYLNDYNNQLHQKTIKTKTIQAYISVLKLFNEYLERYGEAPIITTRLDITKEISTPRNILTKEQINVLYESSDKSLWGHRDRIILALYYGCGLRCAEGIALDTTDIDFTRGLIHIRKGKNYRERYVPMSRGVKQELTAWLQTTHRYFCGKQTDILLPNSKGKRSENKLLNIRLKRLCQNANINQQITLHGLRHSIATHLLQEGMSIELIGQFLGHQSLEATQLYTRIINKDGNI
ncbi:MAG TPA: tyrosine-type recombinase/integrase, partial [Saprospiraceae bacterium]|nr:tyrosine-type recombinase/integrase [Saprospiraceae bacterium]